MAHGQVIPGGEVRCIRFMVHGPPPTHVKPGPAPSRRDRPMRQIIFIVVIIRVFTATLAKHHEAAARASERTYGWCNLGPDS